MAELTWNEALAVNQPQMDETHREFVDLLTRLEAVLERPPHEVLPCLEDLLVHTEQHFGQEERWMTAVGFAPQNCHSYQHAQILEVLREVRKRCAEQGDLEPVRLLVPGLAQWFPGHALAMDAALALTMAERGYDPATGAVQRPLEPEALPITGCGGSGCS
ncbi:MAG: hemerythrin domain-containing protein [Burkholderiales bacterium]|nr:hemerythrin domain-containing protein [Burkholderiales bacterium]MDE1927526.1 hemerythrin domain-containing protein [Burkholderiales bacterium]MDE2157538.1 hemerythrin domain-containing protein [Burkholderiales bacterium]MDE2503975.1 hemerythrin domain-containing protein [Burkholderiales bacterium]